MATATATRWALKGNGKCVFVVDLATTDKQIDVLGQIFTG